jgi:hypothetical protein
MRTRIAALLVVVSGCVGTRTFRSGTAVAYPPTAASKVLVFYSPDDIKRPYAVIGEIDAFGSSGNYVTQGDLTKKACSEAAKLGADAIIVRQYSGGSGGDRALAAFTGENNESEHVSAIRFGQ